MKLESLQLKNFRGFRELEITFDPFFTVLLGGNMAGKTAVLDGTKLVLSQLIGLLAMRSIDDPDVRQVVTTLGGVAVLQPQLPVKVAATIADEGFDNGSDVWSIVREADGHVETRCPYTVHAELEAAPVLAHYGIRRHWDHRQSLRDMSGIGSRYDAYYRAFDIQTSYGALAGWMRRQTYVQLQKGNGYVQPQLAAIEAAVMSCVADVSRLWFDVEHDELRLERTGGDIQLVAMLSEGYRNVVATVADLAWRASVLNPQHGHEAHLLTEGIVLIDEIDLHLHPAWQRRIVDDLRRTFPKMQFIVTTHSPQIVASVSRHQVRLLDRNQLIADQLHVEGRDSNELLEDAFGVPRRPEAAKAEIDEVYRLIDDARYSEARARLLRLEDRLGPEDATIVKIKWILETEDAQQPTEPSAPT